ncbi:ABC transporter permease [Thiotrichales bacterium 19S11-10]|nr:ABC transporter permease [Thiotrichales bacterium 19S11-10]MCF6807081.1 ABC transporter permease [Thiotrichales bacterium 19S9-11]MCF6811050.1 ABC transporter permease [Thiotrichales bacterium 19S9-12]
MLYYVIRRLLYAIPILIGVNLITFTLFFVVNTPDDMARVHLGQKYVSQEAVNQWKEIHGYDKPLFLNDESSGFSQITNTIFFQKSVKLFLFDFGYSDEGRNIGYDITHRIYPSLALAIPAFILGILTNITFALILAFFRRTYLDVWGSFVCVALMSISGLFYIIAGQYLIGKLLKLTPISGFQDGIDAWKFVILPVTIGIVSGIGSGTRWYRVIFLEEMNKEYVKSAKAKGLKEWQVMLIHVLKNGLIPILTGVVVIIPSLFMGSLVMESFFGIPGLGSYTLDAITSQDFQALRAMVFLGSILYIIGLILTDITYALVDPRVRLG